MDVLDKKIEVMQLYDLYSNLLTQKQKQYIEAYYYDDLSITEISEDFSVSRNAVHDQVKRTVKKLYEYEEALKLKEKNKKRKRIIEKIKIISNDKNIEELIDDLEKVE